MQKLLFPMPYMNITTGINQASHLGSNAIDCAGSDSGIDFAIAPFTGVIRKKWANGNTVWIESSAPVLYADGTVDYATVSLTHDNNIDNLAVGQVVQQGQRFYEEGTAGRATGNHIHLEVGRGRFTSTGWYQNAHGNWVINNSYVPYAAFWLDNINVINGYGYPWKRTVTAPTTNTGVQDMTPNFIRRTYYMIANASPTQAEVDFHMAKSNPESFVNGFGDNPLWKNIQSQVITKEVIKEVIVEKPVEKIVTVIKEVPVEKIVTVTVTKEIPIGFDQLSLGELLSAAFAKLFKIK